MSVWIVPWEPGNRDSAASNSKSATANLTLKNIVAFAEASLPLRTPNLPPVLPVTQCSNLDEHHPFPTTLPGHRPDQGAGIRGAYGLSLEKNVTSEMCGTAIRATAPNPDVTISYLLNHVPAVPTIS